MSLFHLPSRTLHSCDWPARFVILPALTAFIALAASAHLSAKGPSDAPVRPVNCDAPGQSLARTVSRASPGTHIYVTGTCRERVRISKGRLIIEGMPGAGLDGSDLSPSDVEFDALITVEGATGVEIRNLSVMNSPAVGVYATSGAGAKLQQVEIQGHDRGIVASASSLELLDVTIAGGATGMQAIGGSSVLVTGDVEVRDTALEAFSILGGFGELRGGHLNIHNNSGLSLVVVGGSSLTVLGYRDSASTMVRVHDNSGPGILLANGTLEIGGAEPTIPTIESFNNQGPGVVMAAGRLLSAVGWARVRIYGNPVGIVAEADSNIWMQGGLEVDGNFGPGLVVSGSVLTLGTGINPVEISGNGGPDVILSFGSRSSINAATTIGSPLFCDPTVLSDGGVSCP